MDSEMCTGTCDPEGAWRPACFVTAIVSLASKKGTDPSVELLRFLRLAGFCLTGGILWET